MSKNKKQITNFIANAAWNLWCVVSIVGIWPRFIEPRLISTTRLSLKIPSLSKSLEGLRILQFSDLHIHPGTSDYLIQKLIRKINNLNPDIIVFTGDFICYSKLNDIPRLKNLLCNLQARYGCYAIFGNHDYQNYVSVNDRGEYDLIDPNASTLRKGWRKLFNTITLKKTISKEAIKTPLKQDLIDLLQQTPFEVLHNSSKLVKIKDSHLNICGLGEHMLGRCLPQKAFLNYDTNFPGIILAHNPDSIPNLKGFPGDIVLCGHTHGGQINLPGLYRKFLLLENMHLKRGLKRLDNKWVYVNRGIGSVMKFRWFSMPEILLLTLEGAHE
jgi:uncharacterized protein